MRAPETAVTPTNCTAYDRFSLWCLHDDARCL